MNDKSVVGFGQNRIIHEQPNKEKERKNNPTIYIRWNTRGVVANVIDCDIIEGVFKL